MPLSISVALLPKLLPAPWSDAHTVAVVIDTLRFTSTACVALAAGAKGVTVVSDIEEARRTASGFASGPALLCGERECVRIPGFDLGNSPAEYGAGTVAERELVFSTTNGTVAVEASQAASQVVLGSLLNRSSLCQWLADLPEQLAVSGKPIEIWCVCAGTDRQVAFEDVLTAGAIADRLLSIRADCQLGNDSTAIALAAWKSVAADNGASLSAHLVAAMRTALGGRNLVDAGFEEDLRLVAAVDSLSIVPRQERECRFVR